MAPKLRVVKQTPDTPGAKPARKLGEHGATLWRSIMSEYAIVDSGGLEMLTQACQAVDRAETYREQIDADGETLASKQGIKEHPLIRHELQARAFVVRTLQRLGLSVEAVKPVGRPPGSFKRG